MIFLDELKERTSGDPGKDFPIKWGPDRGTDLIFGDLRKSIGC